MSEIYLGVNIDHIATLRNARGTQYPDPVQAAFVAEQAGADGITVHLREDRRHITDRDVEILRQTIQTRMNLEMAVTEEMIGIACRIKPHFVCLVPEKRTEVTTEGGLDVAGQLDKVTDAVTRLAAVGAQVSLFIDADPIQIDAAAASGAPFIEIHTGRYADATTDAERNAEFKRIAAGASYAAGKGLKVNAGHGLHYHNVKAIAAIPELYELNIGHAIIGRAAFDGLAKAVSDMRLLMQEARQGSDLSAGVGPRDTKKKGRHGVPFCCGMMERSVAVRLALPSAMFRVCRRSYTCGSWRRPPPPWRPWRAPDTGAGRWRRGGRPGTPSWRRRRRS